MAGGAVQVLSGTLDGAHVLLMGGEPFLESILM